MATGHVGGGWMWGCLGGGRRRESKVEQEQGARIHSNRHWKRYDSSRDRLQCGRPRNSRRCIDGGDREIGACGRGTGGGGFI